jgi:putative methionine-R-sulfoxide reductase with GAF domain
MSGGVGSSAERDAEIRRLQAFLKVSRLMNAETNRARLIHRINDEIRGYLEADRFTVFFYDAEDDELYSYIASGLDSGEIRIRSDHGVAGHVFQTGELLLVEDAYQDPNFDPDVDLRTGYHTTSLLSMPITNKNGKRIGVVQALNKTGGGGFTDEDVHFLTELVDQISDLLDLLLHKEELARQHAEMQEAVSQLKVYEYLIGEKTITKMAMRWMRRLHTWISVVGAVSLMAMTLSGIFVAHDGPNWWRILLYDLHSGKIVFGSWAFVYSDVVGGALAVITVTGIALWAYPPFTRWLKRRVEQKTHAQ